VDLSDGARYLRHPRPGPGTPGRRRGQLAPVLSLAGAHSGWRTGRHVLRHGPVLSGHKGGTLGAAAGRRGWWRLLLAGLSLRGPAPFALPSWSTCPRWGRS